MLCYAQDNTDENRLWLVVYLSSDLLNLPQDAKYCICVGCIKGSWSASWPWGLRLIDMSAIDWLLEKIKK